MEFSLNGVMRDGPVVVTDIGVINTNPNMALICQSEVPGPGVLSNWHLDPENQNIHQDSIIDGDRGWSRSRNITTDNFRQVLLWRSSASETPLEGRFTCFINVDSNTRSLFVLHPSELAVCRTYIMRITIAY